jgi:hypothetical protein
MPPYWYENIVAEYHFEGAGSEIDTFERQREDVLQQFNSWSATWGLDLWDWIYFGWKQSLPIEDRHKNIQQQHWARLGFTPSVLRAIGYDSSPSKQMVMVEDFDRKVIQYSFPIGNKFDTKSAVRAVEKIRPVHCNGVSFEPVSREIVEMSDIVVVGIKEYHIVKEFRVGMTPIKRFEELVR